MRGTTAVSAPQLDVRQLLKKVDCCCLDDHVPLRMDAD